MSLISKEFILVRFPIFFPVTYFLLLSIFPEYETFILIFAILILAEPHFGATWPIFLDRLNFSYINNNKLSLIYGIIFVIIFSLIGFFYFKYTFLLIFFAANIFHVTRQSVGIIKLYNLSNSLSQMIYVNYIFATMYFFIGLSRFYIPIISQEDILILNGIILMLMAFSLIYFKIMKTSLRDLLTFLTGILIFYPICFVDKPVHAIIMGVTMHYSQYLYFTFKVNNGRNRDFYKTKYKNLYYIFFLFIYALLMTSFTYIGKYDLEIFKNLIIIPIIGQMVHFYIDSFIWRFRDKHNRDITLKYIKT